MGPMTAAARFLAEIAGGDWPRPAGASVDRVGASLHGSLAYTGIGHGTDRAVILGLAGLTPVTVDPDKADAIIEKIKAEKRISPPGHPLLPLRCGDRSRARPQDAAHRPRQRHGVLCLRRIGPAAAQAHLLFDRRRLRGFRRGTAAHEVARRAGRAPSRCRIPSPALPQMLEMAAASGLSIAEMKRANEETLMSRRRARRRPRRASGRR